MASVGRQRMSVSLFKTRSQTQRSDHVNQRSLSLRCIIVGGFFSQNLRSTMPVGRRAKFWPSPTLVFVALKRDSEAELFHLSTVDSE